MNFRKFIPLFFLLLTILSRQEGSAHCIIPAEGEPEDTSTPDHIIGTRTPESCTSEAVVDAVAQGGIITFDCGPDPVTIVMEETAKIFNDTGPQIVLDGNNLVTLSGGGNTRILYMNTCDEQQKWTTPHCDNQDHPQLTVQNITFANGNSIGESYDGGGAIWVRGAVFKIINSTFVQNQCDMEGPDVGGAAVRVFSQYNGLPVYVVNSVFGGSAEDANVGSNGGGLSSINVSFTIINSLFSHNRAVGNGGNPADPGTPGGGSGAAIYNDGNTFHLNICGTAIHDNQANQYGGAIFYVSNDGTGTMAVDQSGLWNNSQLSWLTHTGGISHLSDHDIVFTDTFRSDGEAIAPHITTDVNGDAQTGLEEILYALHILANNTTAELTSYARKKGDVDYNHTVDLRDVILGLQALL